MPDEPSLSDNQSEPQPEQPRYEPRPYQNSNVLPVMPASPILGDSQATPFVEPTADEYVVAAQDVEPSTQPITPPAPIEVPVRPMNTLDMSAEAPVTPVPQSFGQPNKKKRLIVAIIAIVSLGLLSGGSALAYNLWYQNPQKVVTDALMNAVTSKSVAYVGTLSGTDGATSPTKYKIEVTGQQLNATGNVDAKLTLSSGGKDYTLNGSALIDPSGDLYFKIEHLTDVIAPYKEFLGNSALIDTLITKVDGVWIKVSSADLADFSASTAKSKTCINETVDKFKNDKAALSQITNLYNKHKFVVVDKELGTKDGNLGYSIKTDKVATKAFVAGLPDTSIYKQLHGCDDTFVISSDDLTTTTASSSSTSESTFELWISTLGHELRKVTTSSKADDNSAIDGSLNFTFNKAQSVKTPASSTTLSQLKTDIEALLQDFSSSETTSATSLPPQ
ncbi:MAG: hypothetical protein ABI716_02830 [Candidatus Saccharibacteria bacterium]